MLDRNSLIINRKEIRCELLIHGWLPVIYPASGSDRRKSRDVADSIHLLSESPSLGLWRFPVFADRVADGFVGFAALAGFLDAREEDSGATAGQRGGRGKSARDIARQFEVGIGDKQPRNFPLFNDCLEVARSASLFTVEPARLYTKRGKLDSERAIRHRQRFREHARRATRTKWHTDRTGEPARALYELRPAHTA